ncbi:MAG TPA: hypothetical protein VG890_08265 [Puia sp.]|nr:hypothetical protein [Puia sp.]
MTEKKLHIEYVQRRQIDAAKWDACVSRASNRLIYAYSFYLDAMAENWDALILNDYEAVMPLPWRRKYSIRYLYQPPYTAQLGVFTTMNRWDEQNAFIQPVLIKTFLDELARHFRFAEIFLNYANPCDYCEPYNNYILRLDRSYEELVAGYKKSYQKYLFKTGQSGKALSFSYQATNHLEELLDLNKRLYLRKMSEVQSHDYDHFKQLCLFFQQNDQLILRTLYGPGNALLATLLLPKDDDRLYLLQSCVTAEGRKAEANHFLMDCFLKEFSGQNITLDFEGSEHPGIAHFYRNFGACNQPRFFFRHNKLPWPLHLLKQK